MKILKINLFIYAFIFSSFAYAIGCHQYSEQSCCLDDSFESLEGEALNLLSCLTKTKTVPNVKEHFLKEDESQRTTDKGQFKITYYGTKDEFSAWIINASFFKDLKNPRIVLISNSRSVYWQLYREKRSEEMAPIRKDLIYQFYIIGKSDLKVDELWSWFNENNRF